MQDLMGRLTALDPDASETLKVVTYFDALVARSVGVESMLRGAALLSGASAGHDDGRRAIRVRADGVRVEPGAVEPTWPMRETGPASMAWLEREGEPHRNDAMVLERLALALGIIQARRSIGAEGAVELAISGYASPEERAGAVARLRLDGPLRVLASLPDPEPVPRYPSAVVITPRGLIRATVLEAHGSLSNVWPATPAPRVGIGRPAVGANLADSWTSALFALRLTTPTEQILRAEDLGAFLVIAESMDAAAMHPDVLVLAALDARSLELLDAIVTERSVRGAAALLGRHHSSVQERVTDLVERLGYDPRTPRGHTRYDLARMLLRLSEA